MNRLLSILVTLFILFLVYLWINHLTGDKPTKANQELRQEPLPQTTLDAPADAYRISDEELPDTTEVTEPGEEGTTNPDDTHSVTPPPPAQEKPVTKPKTPPKPAPEPVKPVSRKTEVATGKHLVIAGNFLEKANAEERVRQLKKLGYTQAEVVNFELSEYHTACAGRYDDLNEARRISRKIKEMHGIDTYVRLGN